MKKKLNKLEVAMNYIFFLMGGLILFAGGLIGMINDEVILAYGNGAIIFLFTAMFVGLIMLINVGRWEDLLDEA